MAPATGARDHRGIAEFTDTGVNGAHHARPRTTSRVRTAPLRRARVRGTGVGSPGSGTGPAPGPGPSAPGACGARSAGARTSGCWPGCAEGSPRPPASTSPWSASASCCCPWAAASASSSTRLAWLLLPLQGETTTIFSRAVNDRRGIRLVIAILPVLVVVQIVADAWHIGYVGSFSWPVFLAAGIAILIRRNASEGERVWINDDLVPMLRSGGERHPRWALVPASPPAPCFGVVGLHHPGLGPYQHGGPAAGRRRPAGHRGHRGGLRAVVAVAWSAT